MGSIATSSPFSDLTSQLIIPNQGLTGLGNPLSAYKYSGTWWDFAMDANGGPNAFTFTGFPSDGVALEVWVNANAADDYVFWAGVGGILSNTGVLATNVAANLLARRHSAAGVPMLLPVQTVGAVPSTWRFAGSKSTSRLQARAVAASSAIPYLSASNVEFSLTGNGASQQLPFTDGTRFPVGTSAIQFQILGPGPARMTWDGTTPSATLGAIFAPGSYLIDYARHGVAVSALRIFMPSGTNLVGASLFAA